MMHCIIGKKKVEEMSEGREDTLDTQINTRSLTTMNVLLVFPLPTFPTMCSFVCRSNFSDLINFQCEESAVKVT